MIPARSRAPHRSGGVFLRNHGSSKHFCSPIALYDFKLTARNPSRRAFTGAIITGSCLAIARTSKGEEEAPFPELGVQTKLENAAAVKAAGGKWVGLSVADWLDPDGPEALFQQRLDAATTAPLPVAACNSFIRRKDLKCNGPLANHDEVIEYSRRAFARAQRAGVRMITFGSSGSRRLPDGFDYKRGMDQFITLLRRMGPIAAEHEVIVQVEQLNSRECNFITRLSEVEKVVRAAEHPNIRGLADLYHMAAENDTPEDLARAVELINHVEIAELKDRAIPGRGGQDFRPFLRVLKEAGYTGRIGIEGRFELDELPGGFSTIRKQWTES